MNRRATSLCHVLAAALATLTLAGCDRPAPKPSLMQAAPERTPQVIEARATVFAPAREGCVPAAVFVSGEPRGSICVEDAATQGFTVIDLSNTWTPRLFTEMPGAKSAPAYRATYLGLAASKNGELGLNGVAPHFSIVAARLNDEERQACDAAVNTAPLATATDKPSKEAVTAAQRQLVCAGLLKPRQVTGYASGSTHYALEAFRRRHMILGTRLDTDTLSALALGGEELAFRAVLRNLRERVADAAGLLEDGSALAERELVVERELDLSRFGPSVAEALPNGAPDLVGRTTDRAARELGWNTPADARSYLSQVDVTTLRVAVPLPDAPAYHGDAMDLRVEIDRGDVFYDTPGATAAARRKLGAVRGATLVVYAKNGDDEVALVRWATTIGGWKKERTESGETTLAYKESDVGDREWRQLVAAPAWLPPDSTPATDLVHEGKDGELVLKRSLVQPGYRNAFGLAMLIHHERVVHGDETRWLDHGIRTHGSVNYRSIQNGTSHGCHRLYNQLVLRLSGFLLQHRPHVPRGTMHAGYERTIEHNEQTVDVSIPTRGYLYELDPPVPVRVLEGRIAGAAPQPQASILLAPEPPKT